MTATSAMLLAAGLGERLRPLTDHVPKPLLFVAGQRLLHRHLDALAGAGVRRVVVNVAHLPAQMSAALRARMGSAPELLISAEPMQPLDTGGGLRRALEFLGPAPFWLVNADVVCDYAYEHASLAEADLGMLVLVARAAHNSAGDFACTAGRVRNDGPDRLTFAGISLLRPSLLQNTSLGRFSIVQHWREAAAADRLAAHVHRGQWFDTGTRERLLQARHV